MREFILLVILVCLVLNKCSAAIIRREVQPNPRFFHRAAAPLDCSQYSHDYQILSSFNFVVPINPLALPGSETYAKMDENDGVYYLEVTTQTSLPKTVFCLQHLQTLIVKTTKFYEDHPFDDSVHRLSPDIERLAPSLRYLHIINTSITHLPTEIGKLTLLSTLSLDNTGLIALPNSIGNLSSLTHLALSNNKLTSLPGTIGSIQTLKSVTLNGNLQLRSVQPLNGLPSLSYLNTDGSPVERIPLNLPTIGNLIMSNNNLTDLIGIGTLGIYPNPMKELIFNNNHIRYVPSEIRFVSNILWLDLSRNELVTLPAAVFNITTLRYINIADNHFSDAELQAIVAKFKSVQFVKLVW